MPEPAATMSGANDTITTSALETVHNDIADATAVKGQSETKSASLSSGPAIETATGNLTSAFATTDLEPKEIQTETDGPTASASATGPTETETTLAASSGILETPRPPPAAVTRGHSDSQPINPDNKVALTTSPVDSGLVCNITLLLPNGNRHPFRIDERYLTKRGVEVPDLTESGRKDPFSVSIYKLKELILREWREDWEGKPASPSSIRLIHFGKLLDDKEQLRKYHFSSDAPNVVHMSVKPPEMMEDDEAAKGKSSNAESRSREGGSGCCVIL